MTNQATATCRYCHATLPQHVSMAAHYATCTVLANCLAPAAPFPSQGRISEAEKASRADQQHEITRARARRKAEKQK